MSASRKSLTIGALAREAGVNVETIRFYQRQKLMTEPDRPLGSIRRYGESDLARVHFIRAAQRLGFNLNQVAELLALEDGTHCNETRKLAEQKLRDVCEKLDDLRRIEAVLRQLVARCGSVRGSVKCPLISSLQQS
jgi:MerR family mercuric resistance operon transcriptional regulator